MDSSGPSVGVEGVDRKGDSDRVVDTNSSEATLKPSSRSRWRLISSIRVADSVSVGRIKRISLYSTTTQHGNPVEQQNDDEPDGVTLWSLVVSSSSSLLGMLILFSLLLPASFPPLCDLHQVRRSFGPFFTHHSSSQKHSNQRADTTRQ